MNFRNIVLPVLVFAVALPLPAAAQAETRITEEAIHAFYKEAAEIYKLPYDQYAQYMQNFMTEDFSSSIVTTVNIPGQAPVQQAVNDTKATVLKNMQTSYDAMKNGSVTNSVLAIQISEDGKSASVSDSTTMNNMLLPNAGPNPIYMDGGGPCADKIVLAPAGHLQVQRSECSLTMNVRPGREL